MVHDALTGEPVANPPAPLETVRINNRLRRVLANAIGGLTLMAPEPQRRRAAADAIFSSRDDSRAAICSKRRSRPRKLPAVTRAFQQARAAILRHRAGDDARSSAIDAINVLRDRADMGAIAALRSINPKADAEDEGTRREPPSPPSKAA